MKKIIARFARHRFLFEELVKRDFKQKYKRTVLGMGWSLLSPLLTLLVMKIVFTQFFGRDMEHYTTYLFSGTLLMSYFKETTKGGMSALMGNARIITKINVPKYLFILSKSISGMVNFGITLIIYFLFCALDGITFGFHMLSLIYPVLCLTVLSIGVGMILSALFVFFRDISYLYDIFLTLLTYMSAIFYTLDRYPVEVQRLFLLNPVYVCIKYFRVVTMEGRLPSLEFHALCGIYALVIAGIGAWCYKKNNHKFLYYL